MPDSLNSTASDDTQDTALVDADAEDSSNDVDADAATTPEPDVNQDALRASIEATRLQADVESVKRATGHIRGLQSSVASLERQFAKVTDLEQSNQQLAARFDTLIDALVDANLVTDRAGQNLRPQRGDSNAEIMAKFESLEERLTAGSVRTAPEVDAAASAPWVAATKAVHKYAADKGFDPDQIPQAIWDRAEATGDPTGAAVEVMRFVEGELAKRTRRGERQEAASGGAPERSARKGALTMASLKAMSVDEVREYDKANPGVIDEVMRKG